MSIYNIPNSLNELRNYKVVKANDLIQKSRFSLSLQEQKIILFLISKIKPYDNNFIEQTFDIIEFCKVCGIEEYNGKNYKNLKDSIKTLSDKSVWIKTDEKTETIVRWINKAWVYNKSGKIKIRLDDDMKPYLLQLQKRFTQYELLYTLAMKSQYSIRIYELLKSYEYTKSKTFDIDDFRILVSAENYTRFGDLKRKVLDISMREINQLSDISVNYDIIKKGRKYQQLKFNVSLKENINERMDTWENIESIINPPQQSLYKIINGE